jgi:hypothetical protein
VLRKLLLPLLLLATFASAATPTHEETVVRTAYAKLAYAVDVNTVYSLAIANPTIKPEELNREVEARGLRFQLSNFKVGNLSDISNEKYDVLGQYPDGQDIIQTSTVERVEIGAPTSMEVASAKWEEGPSSTAPDMTVREMMPAMQSESGIKSLLVRYCTYTVTATLAGRSRTYDASFLFAADGEVVTGDVVAAIGGGPLLHFISHPVYPTVLLKGALAKTPAVRNFLEAGQRPESTCVNGEVCCDTAALRCGVPSADLRRLPLTRPANPEFSIDKMIAETERSLD